ncbi:MAG TPA: FMN-binding protein [Patescibacteria group bacterium]|nr:FMN-binding protein [Patescibacteria group bacterium]
MKKALIIIAAIALLGILAAYVNPLGPEKPAAITVKTSSTSLTSTATSSSTPTTYQDGTFQGSDAPNPYGDVQISVTIHGGRIVAVNFNQLPTEDGRSQEINSQAAPLLRSQTLSAQSAQIDGVSGATYTTSSYEQSLQSALDKAHA